MEDELVNPHQTPAPIVAKLAEDPEFTAAVDALRKRAGEANVVLDFVDVKYLTSANLALLLTLRRDVLNADRLLRICCVNPTVWKLFTITGLDKVFEVAKNVDEALATLNN